MLYTKNVEDYNKLLKKVKDAKLEHHTYSLPGESNKRLVLKGLPPNISPEEVKADLASKNLKFSNVVRMMFKDDKGAAIPSSLFIDTFTKESTFRDIYSANRVCYCVVKWEKYKNSKGVTQCYKCQSFGHVARNCFRTVKCAKCAQAHNTTECASADDMVIKCANCDGPHAANSRECPKYTEQLESKSRRQSTRVLPPQRAASRFFAGAPSQQDFPSLRVPASQGQHGATRTSPRTPRSQSGRAPVEDPISFSNILRGTKALFSNDCVNNLIEKVKLALVKFKTASDGIAKVGVIVEFVLSCLE